MRPLFTPTVALFAAHALAAAAAPHDTDLGALEREYLACERRASVQRLSADEAAACSLAGEQLLQRRFGGDFERLLQWWRTARDASEPARTPFEAAQAHYEAGRYEQAFALFAELADCGHREAARIALQMRRLGPQLYGIVFQASPSRVARWHGTLASDGAAGVASCTTA